MADKVRPGDDPSLELPSFKLPGKKRPAADSDPTPSRRPRRPAVRLPQLTGLFPALVTGAVVGGLTVLFVWLATSACGAVRGTSSCGGGPGLVILVATMLLLAYLGGWMLRSFGVAEPGSTSFLGVGVMAVVLLAFFSGVLDEVWMVAVVPLVAIAAYILSWWVTAQVAGESTPG